MELVRYLQKMFLLLSCEIVFSYNKACFQERTNPWSWLFQHFLDENFNFSGLEDLRRSKENISADLPLPSLPMATDLQTFSGFWPFAPLGRRVWILGQAEERKAVGAGSRTRTVHACRRGEALLYVTSAAFWSPSGAPACGSRRRGLRQRSHLLKPLPGAALYAQQSLFYLCFPQWFGVCPCAATSFVLPGVLGFGVSRELRAPIALIVFTPAYFHCGCHYSCVMFLLSLLSWLSLPWQAQSDSLIHIC